MQSRPVGSPDTDTALHEIGSYLVVGAAIVALLLVVARSVLLRRKRSPPTPATVELEPGTLKLDPAAPPSKRPSQEGDGAL